MMDRLIAKVLTLPDGMKVFLLAVLAMAMLAMIVSC